MIMQRFQWSKKGQFNSFNKENVSQEPIDESSIESNSTLPQIPLLDLESRTSPRLDLDGTCCSLFSFK